MEIKVEVADLQIGMYVTELDRPWSDTNFLFQGFIIEREDQLEELSSQCSYVIVSQEKSQEGLFKLEPKKIPVKDKSSLLNTPTIIEVEEDSQISPKTKSDGLFSSIKKIGKEIIGFKNNKPQVDPKTGLYIEYEEEQEAAETTRKEVVNVLRKTYASTDGSTQEIIDYATSTTVEEELKHARRATDTLNSKIASTLMLEMTGNDLSDRIEVAKEVLGDVVNSIIRNPNAMLLINNLKTIDDLTYRHAVDMSVMLVSFGRQLGIPKQELNDLALGGLLHDIGKSKVPSEIIKKPHSLNASEYAEAQKHVEYGMETIRDMKNISRVTQLIISRHHERYDGRGYPNQLRGEEIGLYGSMAGIVETYASMTTNMPYAVARSSSKAVSVLVAMRGKAFQSELVDQFIQVVGVYPVGSIVQLSTNEVGIVIRQNKLWRLKPIVTVVRDSKGNKLAKQRTLDLVRDEDDKNQPISISSELPAGTFGIDPKDFFL